MLQEPNRSMLRKLLAGFNVDGFRGVKGLPNQPNSWKIVGPAPEFELQFPQPTSSRGWAVLSFDLDANGAPVDQCRLSTLSGTGRHSVVELSPARRRSGVIWLSAENLSIRIRIRTKASIVTICPVSVRSIGRVEARIRMLLTLLRTRGRDPRWLMRLVRWTAAAIGAGSPRLLGNWILDEYLVPETIDASS